MILLLCARWFYVVPLIVDKDVGFSEAMGISWRRVGLHQWRFILLNQMAVLIWAAGLLLCGIGVFFTWPFYLMIMAAAYTIIFDAQDGPAAASEALPNGYVPKPQPFREVGGADDIQSSAPEKSRSNVKVILFAIGLSIVLFLLAFGGLAAVVAIPSFSKAPTASQANACINNLRQIDAAANQFALENKKKTGDPIRFTSDLTPYIKLDPAGHIPACPSGGIYKCAAVGDNPTCSLGSSVTPAHALP
jgi:hypothetical protein